MKGVILWAALFVVVGSSAAQADPVTTAISVVTTWLAAHPIAAAVLRIAIGVVMSAVAKAKARKAAGDSGGIRTDVTLVGGDNSDTFILGRYATAGAFACPPISRGDNNRILTCVVDVAGLPGHTLNTVYVDGQAVEFDGPLTHGQKRKSLAESFGGLIEITYFDGSQTTAPAHMLEHYAAHPDFPWDAEMIGRGRCYAILEFTADQDIFPGIPELLFDVQGLPMLDRRTGVAGQTENLARLSERVLFGVPFPDGSHWGGGADEEDLPLSQWAAAMNECDMAIEKADGGTEPQFRGGFEVRIADDQPAEVLERLIDACGGDLAEECGVWHVRVGPPALPSFFLTDGDLIHSKPSDLDRFPGLAETVNGLSIKFPNPDAIWAISEAEQVLRPDLEAEDDGRRLHDSLNLSACPYPLQVQRVGKAYVADSRRFRKHRFSLPPDAGWLPPLATISWTSERNQYTGKLFQIEKKQTNVFDLNSAVGVRETNPADNAWSPADELPVAFVQPKFNRPPLFALNDLMLTPGVVKRSDGGVVLPAIAVTGVPDFLEAVEWRVTIDGAYVAQGRSFVEGGAFHVSGELSPDQEYEVEFRPVGNGVAWSDRYTAKTGLARPGVVSGVSVAVFYREIPAGLFARVEWTPAQGVPAIGYRVEVTEQNGTRRHVRDVLDPFAEIQLTGAEVGDMTVHVAALGHMANSAFKDFGFSIQDAIRFPGAVSDFRVSIFQDQAQLRWGRASGAVSHYHIRHLRGASGGWNDAVDIDTDIPGRSATVPALPGRYLIKAVGVYGEYSRVHSEVSSTIVGLAGYNVVKDVALHPGFDGVLDTGLEKTVNGLRLGPAVPGGPVVGEALFSSSVVTDLGAPVVSRVTATVDGFGYDFGRTWDKWGPWSEVGSWAGDVDGTWQIRLQISTTQDDPNDPAAVWTDWAELLAGDYLARAYRYRVLFRSLDPDASAVLRAVSVQIDVPDRITEGADVVCPAAGVYVPFDPPFMEKPAISVDGQGLPQGWRSVRSNASREGFHQRFVNSSGYGIACTFDYIAKGYGRLA